MYDLPGSIRTVPPDHVKKWDVAGTDLFEIGLNNVRAEGRPQVQTFDLEKGAQFFALVGESFFTSSTPLSWARLSIRCRSTARWSPCLTGTRYSITRS